MELSLIGLQNAGKTSLVNVIASGAFHEDMIPTVGFNMRKVTRGAVTIKLWDLGGQVFRQTPPCTNHPSVAVKALSSSMASPLFLSLHVSVTPLPVFALGQAVMLRTEQLSSLHSWWCAASLQEHVGAVLPRGAGHCVCGRCGRP